MTQYRELGPGETIDPGCLPADDPPPDTARCRPSCERCQQLEELDALCKRLIDTNGEDFQLTKMQEECGELVAAIAHFEQERISVDDLCEEIADVAILVRVFHTMFPDSVRLAIAAKVKRATERLDETAARARMGKP